MRSGTSTVDSSILLNTQPFFFHFQYIIRKTVFFFSIESCSSFLFKKKCSVGFTQTPTLLKLIEINAHSTSLSNTNVYIHVEKSPGLPKISGEPGQPLIDQWSCRETWWRFWWRLCLASTLCSESSIFTFNMYIYVRCLSHYRFISPTKYNKKQKKHWTIDYFRLLVLHGSSGH